MAKFEKLQIWGLGLMGLAYAGFVLAMTEGGQLAALTPAWLLLVLSMYVVVLGVAMGFLFIRALDGRTRADERENAIDGRAERAGYYGVEAAMVGLMLLVLADALWGGLLGSFRLDRPEAVVFALVSVSTFGGICRFVAGWWAARSS